MAFIQESLILDSISHVIQDIILPIGGMYGTFTSEKPDVIKNVSGNRFLLSKNPLMYNPANDTSDYYDIIKRRLERIDSTKNFNPNNLIYPVELLPPNNSDFNINYINRTLIKSSTVTSPLEATYSYKVVKVLTSWPEFPEQIEIPTISINSGQFDGTQWALGSEKNNNKYLYYIEIWAGNNTQRSWLCSLLEQAFRVDLPLINFELGYPVLSNGNINPSFDSEAQRIRWLRIEKCRFTYLPNTENTSTLEKSRASGTLIVSLIV